MSEVMQDYVTGGLVLSIMINLFLFCWFGFTGIGRDASRRFFQKRKYRRGGFAYSLIFTKEGLIKEVFERVNEGKFKFDGKPYVRNPRLTKPFRGIPAHIHMEDVPTPIDPWSADKEDTVLSCGELDTVLVSQANFDIREWVQMLIPYILMGLAVLVIILIAGIFFGYSNYQALKVAGSVVSGTPIIPS